jgi:glucose 1-dehydrogenase
MGCHRGCMQRLAGKVVLVTGASKGIGHTLALGCARAGADVIVNYNSDREGAEEAVAAITAMGRRAVALQADVGKVKQIERMFARARKTFSRLDVLINNAGLTGWSELFATTEAKWDLVLDTNLKGTFFCSLEAARWMRETKTAGTIVNVSTMCAERGMKNLAAYATSKAGINGLTTQLAIELAPWRIRVNAFSPGPIAIERNLKDDPKYRQVWSEVIPLGRAGEVEEMIGPALFLASDDSSYVTGQLFQVDGGWTSAGPMPRAYFDKAAKKRK